MAVADMLFVRNWDVDIAGETERFGTSDNSGYINSHSGSNDWTSTVLATLNDKGPVLSSVSVVGVGVAYDLEHYEDGTIKGLGEAMLRSYSISANKLTGGPVTVSYDWGGKGAYTNPTGANAILSSKDGNVKWGLA